MLLTRLPLTLTMLCKNSLDLHVLGTPPALTLSQDQTLHKNLILIEFALALNNSTLSFQYIS